MTKLSEAQRRALAAIAIGPCSASDIDASVATMTALCRRRLIRVETTFDSIAYPRSADATITDAGRAALTEQE